MYVCVDGVDVAGAQQVRLLPRALDLGLRLAPVVLGGLEVGRGAGLLLEELLLALVVVLGGDEVGLGLVHVAHGVADVGRLDDRERVALLHALPELRDDLHDAPGHRREDVRRRAGRRG